LASGSPINFEPNTIEQTGFLSRADVIKPNAPEREAVEGGVRFLTEREAWRWWKVRMEKPPLTFPECVNNFALN